MQEALERILGYIPTYLRTLPDIVSTPKRFIREQFSQGERQLENALVFLGISFLIGWVLKSSFGDHSFIELATDAAFLLIEVLAYGTAVLLVWRIVQGRAQTQKIFITHFYYSGVLSLLYSCWFMLSIGAMRIGNPALYKLLFDNIHKGNMQPLASQEAKETLAKAPAFLIVYFVGLILLFAWFFVGWGAYRELNGLSKFRSSLAATLFMPFFFLISALIYMIAAAGVK